MIQINYSLSSMWELERHKFDLTKCDVNALTFNVFSGGIVLKIGGVDFSAMWDWIPVLGFAREFLGAIEMLSKKNLEVFNFTESDAEIVLERKKSMIQVSASYASSGALVEYEELKTAALNFYRKAINDFLVQYPDLNKNENFRKLLLEAKNGKIRDRMTNT